MNPRSTRTVASRAIMTVAVSLLLLVGLVAPAGAATPTPTSSTLAITAVAVPYGQAERASVTVLHSVHGYVTFSVDGKAIARPVVGTAGKVTVTLPAGLKVGRHVVRATYAPTAGTNRLGSSAARAFDVTRATVGWSVSVPYTPVYGGPAAFNVRVLGAAAVNGQVTVSYAGRVLQRHNVGSDGRVAFRLPASWGAGNLVLTFNYTGNATYKPSSRPVAVHTAKASSATRLSAPAALGFGAGSLASVSVSGAGAVPTGAVTLYVDGIARSAHGLSGGRTTLAIPALSGGRHTLLVSYPGDARHNASRQSAVITAASNQCRATARACVDLTHSLTWLQTNGRVTYGPVPITSGRPGYRSEDGTFSVFWKDINHHSSEFNNAPMPYSVFFDGGIAFHEGSLAVESHGCIHLSGAAAQHYFATLQVGDQVSVFGYAPY